MQIIIKRNIHKDTNNSDREYGCVCPRCGSVFIFKRSEASIPRVFNITDKDLTIQCPNDECKNIISLSSNCVESFKGDTDKNNFITKYDE